MEYKSVTKEMLLERIKELETLNKELLLEKEQEETLEFAWSGNLGHWYWNVTSDSVEFNPLKVTTLGYNKNEIPEHVSYQFFTDLLHPDDYQKTMDAMLDHLHGKAPVYEAEYRIRTKSGSYKWYYDRGKITLRSEDGKPLFLAGIVFDITERKEMQFELERKNMILSELSAIDGLTSISNRRTLIEFLMTETAASERTGRPLTVAIFDIDDFKKINDSKGHITGDKVLTETARIISAGIRENDIAGRYGGEEFMIIFPGTDLDSAYNAAERIRSEVEKHLFEDGIRITISGGVRQYSGEAPEDLVRAADSKLYESKRKGKNLITK